MKDIACKRRLEANIEALKDMRDVMLSQENWECMTRLIDACTAGAMAIQRIIEEDFGGNQDE